MVNPPLLAAAEVARSGAGRATVLAGDQSGVAVMAVANELDSGDGTPAGVDRGTEDAGRAGGRAGRCRHRAARLTTLSVRWPTPVPQSGRGDGRQAPGPRSCTRLDADPSSSIGRTNRRWWTTFRGRRLKVLAAEPIDDELRREPCGPTSPAPAPITWTPQVQPEGKSAVAWPSFAQRRAPGPASDWANRFSRDLGIWAPSLPRCPFWAPSLRGWQDSAPRCRCVTDGPGDGGGADESNRSGGSRATCRGPRPWRAASRTGRPRRCRRGRGRRRRTAGGSCDDDVGSGHGVRDAAAGHRPDP